MPAKSVEGVLAQREPNRDDARRKHNTNSDWPVSKGCIPPYVSVRIETMAKRKE